MSSITQYLELYDSQRALIASESAAPLNAPRSEARAALERVGMPTRKVEEYRYTDMERLYRPDLGVNLRRLAIPVNPYEAFRCDVPNLSTQLYFVINDQLHTATLPKAQLPEGVVVGSLRDIARERPELITPYYNSLARDGAAPTQLNTMLAEDGLVIYVPQGVRIDKTIQVVNILRSDVPLMVCRRVLVIAEKESMVRLLFCDHAADDREFLTTQVMEVFAGEGSDVAIYGLEETHQQNTLVSETFISQAKSSRVRHSAITLHNGQTRQTVRLSLDGPDAECWLDGAVIADKQQHVDNNTLIDHRSEGCRSHELYKYVLDGEATGAFAGRVLVRHGAQKTESDERNQNLLATPTARMWTQPMLEIYADDVQCTHGSTVGQLNDAALFYMRQRGIPLAEARLLLQTAFVTEVIDNIPLEPLRDRLRYLVEKRFRGELATCRGCTLCR